MFTLIIELRKQSKQCQLWQNESSRTWLLHLKVWKHVQVRARLLSVHLNSRQISHLVADTDDEALRLLQLLQALTQRLHLRDAFDADGLLHQHVDARLAVVAQQAQQLSSAAVNSRTVIDTHPSKQTLQLWQERPPMMGLQIQQ